MRTLRVEIDARIEGAGLVGRAVRAACGTTALTDDAIAAIELCVVEAVTNAIQHGRFPLTAGAVRVILDLSRDRVVATITDRGEPIPAESLAAAGPQVFDFDPDDWDRLPESGLGLAIIKSAMDEVRYERIGDENVLVLSKARRTRETR